MQVVTIQGNKLTHNKKEYQLNGIDPIDGNSFHFLVDNGGAILFFYNDVMINGKEYKNIEELQTLQN